MLLLFGEGFYIVAVVTDFLHNGVGIIFPKTPSAITFRGTQGTKGSVVNMMPEK